MRVLFHLHFGCWVDLVGCVGQLMFFCLNSPHFILNCFASISDLHQGQLTAAFHIHTTIDGRVGQSMPESTHTVTDGARRETQKPVLWVRLIWAVQPFLFHVMLPLPQQAGLEECDEIEMRTLWAFLRHFNFKFMQ